MLINRQNLEAHIEMVSKKLGIKPKVMETKLKTAYDAGYFDGYHEGVDEAHGTWTTVLPTVEGIGPKRVTAIMQAITTEMKRRQEEKGVKKAYELGSVHEAEG